MIKNNNIELRQKEISKLLQHTVLVKCRDVQRRDRYVKYYNYETDSIKTDTVHIDCLLEEAVKAFSAYDLFMHFRDFCGYKTKIKETENLISEVRELYNKYSPSQRQ